MTSRDAANTSALTQATGADASAKPQASGGSMGWIKWIVIAVVIVVVGYFAYKYRSEKLNLQEDLREASAKLAAEEKRNAELAFVNSECKRKEKELLERIALLTAEHRKQLEEAEARCAEAKRKAKTLKESTRNMGMVQNYRDAGTCPIPMTQKRGVSISEE